MSILFIAITNRAGIACASNTDRTIYQLSKVEPVALAVSPASPIPWDDIIERYRRKGEPEHHEDFADYARDFGRYLETVEAKPEWKNLSINDANMVFMGYGTHDLYPCIYDTSVVLDESSIHLILQDSVTMKISNDVEATWNYIGDFENVNPLLNGATTQMNDFMIKLQMEVYDEYAEKVCKRFAGTKYEQFVKDNLDKFDKEKAAIIGTCNATMEIHKSIEIGLDSFSIEDMVSATETIVDANIRLSHLKSGRKEVLGHTKEIAVITRSEGLTWIKHSLFAI